MHRGRYSLGEEVHLAVLCKNSSGVPTDPDACPKVDVYSSSGHPVAGKLLPVLDPAATTGLFAGRLFLSEDFSPGRYTVATRWLVSGVQGVQLDHFTVLEGGGASGQVISLYAYERPQATFLIQQRTSGRIYKGKNPRL